MRPTTIGDLRIRDHGDCVVAGLPTEIDLANAPGLRTALLRLLNAGVPALVMDMTACRFCDSSGVDVLLRAHIRAGALDVPLRLVLPPAGTVRTVCEIQVSPTVASALTSAHRHGA